MRPTLIVGTCCRDSHSSLVGRAGSPQGRAEGYGVRFNAERGRRTMRCNSLPLSLFAAPTPMRPRAGMPPRLPHLGQIDKLAPGHGAKGMRPPLALEERLALVRRAITVHGAERLSVDRRPTQRLH